MRLSLLVYGLLTKRAYSSLPCLTRVLLPRFVNTRDDACCTDLLVSVAQRISERQEREGSSPVAVRVADIGANEGCVCCAGTLGPGAGRTVVFAISPGARFQKRKIFSTSLRKNLQVQKRLMQ